MAEATVNDIKKRIEDIIEGEVSSAFKVLRYIPDVLYDELLPVALVLPMSSQRNRADGGGTVNVRQFSATFYLRRIDQGREGEAQLAAMDLDLFEQVYDAFDGRQTLQYNDLPGIVAGCELVGDSGLVARFYPATDAGNPYWAIAFTITTGMVYSVDWRN